MRRRIKKATEKQQVARACAFFGFHSFRKARSGGPFAFAASDGGAVALDARVKPAHDGWGVARASHPFLSSPSASEPRVHRAAAQGSPRYRSEEHTSELQSLMRISYAVFCLKKQKNKRDSLYNDRHNPY